MNTIGQDFIVLNSAESTNNYALDRLHANLAAHGAAYFALEQTKGKGQHGKTWNSAPKGSDIILSVVLDSSSISIHQQFLLSAMVAVSVHNFFSKYAGDETKIKWPNDLYWNDRKAGGILIEFLKNRKWAVAGIGININQTKFPEQLKNPVSLKQITGKEFDAVELAKELCTYLQKGYESLQKGEFKNIIEAYNLLLYKRSQTTKLKKGNAVFSASINGVNKTGELLVSDCMYETFKFGEIEWII
jgi:BirA family biotin operon repressor/biotin-[acetyl-CoA-carboxylase] ligase